MDTADGTPAPGTVPPALPARPESRPVTVVGGPRDSGQPHLMGPGPAHATLRGQGYFSVRWSGAGDRCTGPIRMPSWTRLQGRLFHVASGGGRRTDDPALPADDPARPWTGPLQLHRDRLPAGAQQMWQEEFYHLDGEVALHHNGGCLPYLLAVAPTTRQYIDDDLRTPPGRATGTLRYGHLRDRTGRDDAPIPQYLTRRDVDPATVGQRSEV